MKQIRSLKDLDRFRRKVVQEQKGQVSAGTVRVNVALGSCGIAAGALNTMEAIRREVEDIPLPNVIMTQIGCMGLCRYEPVVEVVMPDSTRVTYGRVTPRVAQHILRDHVLDGRVVDEFVVEA